MPGEEGPVKGAGEGARLFDFGRRIMEMKTLRDRIQAAWGTGDPLAFHREVELLAAEGHSQQALEDALDALLLAVRKAWASGATEETINGVWDRFTGWCHADLQIGAHSGRESS
jgi:hypothetical protein